MTEKSTRDASVRIVLGLGCRPTALPDALHALALRALREAGVEGQLLSAVATIDRREGDGTVEAVAARLGVPVLYFSAERLEAETPRLVHPSQAVFRAVGCHGVAEAAALAGAGADARFLLAKIADGNMTAAIAASPGFFTV